MTANELLELSEIVLNYREVLIKINSFTPHNNLDEELERLTQINYKLCNLAEEEN